MSSGRVAAVRDGLKAALAPLGEVFAVLPERITPPAVLLQPDDPWVTTGDGLPYRTGLVHYRVVLIVRPGVNDAQENAVTSMVEDALDALHESGSDWTVSAVVAPYDLAIGQATFLAARLTVTCPARLTTD